MKIQCCITGSSQSFGSCSTSDGQTGVCQSTDIACPGPGFNVGATGCPQEGEVNSCLIEISPRFNVVSPQVSGYGGVIGGAVTVQVANVINTQYNENRKCLPISSSSRSYSTSQHVGSARKLLSVTTFKLCVR